MIDQMYYRLPRVAMVVPNGSGIYALDSGITVMHINDFAQHTARDGRVSFHPDGYSDPITRVMYGRGLDCWYILDESELV
jgi:hypothetical protein